MVYWVCTASFCHLGAYRGGLCEKLAEYRPLCLAEPKTACSKMNMLLTKAGQIRDGGNTPVTIYLRRKKKSYCTDVTVAKEKQSKNM